MSVKIGVLALQGDFREHKQMLQSLGVEAPEVRKQEQLEGLSGLIVPGGESTTIGKLAREYGLEQAVRERVEQGSLAVWGTCAGAIWLAKEIIGYPEQPRAALLDIAIRRNAFGRQVDSFEEPLEIQGFATPFPAVFIRAPVIERVGPGVEVLAREGNRVVLVRSGKLMASSFHPELTGDSRLHRLFVEMARG
ncbi:MAG: pyridoxal 5'-phosphate synthase glutaminase subunit PdxT [Meiothermus silvanus]|nr:pyridoxal 5'-phosphate synthase glutaminase subunit PdxT [Allomeiothermus silvanus]MCL6567725.1 pyridoxal 5'-phosphate synthase glutaminase subunit PdxT [Allomeiothermus silvanus]